ncbi:Uncharacterized protein TCM_037369 [Theobroma cacao]|uniref:Uncharacterized protein n=1 Tax=Theobroma cacao TaxID=3641 RepID=A0A061GKS5_THECC|nr:Uncharacterized protein TCM_037369 [Theobroma cacao]
MNQRRSHFALSTSLSQTTCRVRWGWKVGREQAPHHYLNLERGSLPPLPALAMNCLSPITILSAWVRGFLFGGCGFIAASK